MIGNLVAVSMREVVFDSYEPGHRYTMPIAVRNTSVKGQRIRFIPPRSHALSLAVQNDIEVAAGLEVLAEISLCSVDGLDIFDQFVICVGRSYHADEELIIPIRALQPMANLSFESLLDFQEVVEGQTEARSLHIVNHGTRDGKISISLQPACKFSIMPAEAVVPIGTSLNLKVEFDGSHLGPATTIATVMTEGGNINGQKNSAALKLRANCVKHSLELRDGEGKAIDEKIDFGRLYFGLETSTPLILINNGPTAINWTSSKGRPDDASQQVDGDELPGPVLH